MAQSSQGVGRIDGCLTVPSYCRERAGRDHDLSASCLYRLHEPRHYQCCHYPHSHHKVIPAARAPPSPSSHAIVVIVVVVAGIIVIIIVVVVVVVGVWLSRVRGPRGLTDASQC